MQSEAGNYKQMDRGVCLVRKILDIHQITNVVSILNQFRQWLIKNENRKLQRGNDRHLKEKTQGLAILQLVFEEKKETFKKYLYIPWFNIVVLIYIFLDF